MSDSADDFRSFKAAVSQLPHFSGDGYGYGGGYIVTFGNLSILAGEGDSGRELSKEIALRWNHRKMLADFAVWVETWVSNDAEDFSTDALNGLFGMARDKIAFLHDKRGAGNQ